MKIWFLRIKHPDITREMIKRAHLAPILFREVPLKSCSVSMDEDEIEAVVQAVYKAQSAATRQQHAGTLRRYLADATPGDLVGIKVNRDPDILYGRFGEGDVRPFPALENPGVKGRPFVPLDAMGLKEIDQLSLPLSVLKYRGTFCNWLSDEGDEGVDLPDERENQRREIYTQKAADQLRQIKFIRVGADLGCGQRLSRIFPGNYYHFIPIPKHNDPEFCRFTYGDVGRREDGAVATKGRSLSNLRRDDVLVFYAGFDPDGGARCGRLVGIFGYLVVKEAFMFSRCLSNRRALRFSDRPRTFDPFAEFSRVASVATWKELEARYGKWNAHFSEVDSRQIDLIICGDRKESRLLTKVAALAEFAPQTKNYVLGKKAGEKWGLTTGHDLKMSPVRTVAPNQVDEVYDRLKSAE
jgi:hypothetical protein